MAKAPTEKPQADQPEPTREQVNRRFWDRLGKSDPRHTKPITGRGFDGTALKPMWQNMRMTEVFGPYGLGWGLTEAPVFDTRVFNDSMLVYCTLGLWYVDPETNERSCPVYGVGGDVVAGKRNNGKLFIDDEAYKKAYTDALGNAFKFVGVAADIHMGMFDDSKYVQEQQAAFEREDDTLGKSVDAMQDRIKAATTMDELIALNAEINIVGGIKEQLAAARRGGEWNMLVSIYQARKARLTADAAPKEALADQPKEPADQA